MNDFGIPSKLIKLTRLKLEDTKCRIKFLQSLAENLDIFRSNQKGDSLSYLLFNIALERIIRDSNINSNGYIFSRSIQLLVYTGRVWTV